MISLPHRELWRFSTILGRHPIIDRRTDDADSAALDPGWLRMYWSDGAVERALEDVGRAIEGIHGATGRDAGELHVLSFGVFYEATEIDGGTES